MSIKNNITQYISSNRDNYTISLRGDVRYWSLSATLFSYYRIIIAILSDYAKGNLIDIGAGNLSSKIMLQKYCCNYTSADIKQSASNDIDIVCDIHDMSEVSSDKFDTVYCSQVLEHCYNPSVALSEMFRILKPGGCLIVSVPHLSGLHEEPNDYFRFTPYGLSYLLTATGYRILEERRVGGLFSFLSHNISFVIICSTWSMPLIKWIFWYLNKILVINPAVFADDMLNTKNKFPKTVLAVAQKPV